MEVSSVRCCDTAAVVALINMLKVNLSSTPEIYNTLLAVLCDFDPSKHGSRERTVRYIRLLVSDKVLANCLLMSLPQGNHQFRNTGSIPDMKKAIRQKFLGMNLNVNSPMKGSDEQSEKPANTSSQNITIIITDQGKTEENTVLYSNNRSLLHVTPQCADYHNSGSLTDCESENSSSQINCVTPVVKSSAVSSSTITEGKNSFTSQLINATASVSSSVTVQSSQNVTPNRTGAGSKNDQSKVIGGSADVCQTPVVKISSTSTPQSKATELTTRATSSQCFKQDNTNCMPHHSAGLQHPQQNLKTSYAIPQSRLPGAIVPFPYFSPVQSNMSYNPCLPGPRMNTLFPWTPFQYLPSYVPGYNFGSVGHYVRHSSVAGVEDSSLDLSLPRTNLSNTQNSQGEMKGSGKTPNIALKGTKRCASMTCIPIQSQTSKQKMRKLSLEIPVCPNTKHVQTHKGGKSSYQTSGSTYLRLADSTNTNTESKPNSIQALQELTSRINPKPNAIPLRKAVSTGSISESCQTSQSADIQDNFASGNKGTLGSCTKSVKTALSSSQRWHLTDKTLTTWSKTGLPRPSTNTYSVVRRKDIALPNNERNSVTLHQEHGLTACATTSSEIFSISKSGSSTLDKCGTITPSYIQRSSSNGSRNFPYSQHIQLPDGKCSVLDFPAVHTKSSSVESHNNGSASLQKPAKFSCQSGTNLENTTSIVEKVDSSIDSNLRDNQNKFPKYISSMDILNAYPRTVGNDRGYTDQPKEPRNSERGTGPGNSNKTCLIIETASENGTKQVQFKLDQQSSASLLGELLKLKPAQNSSRTDCLPASVPSSCQSTVNISKRNADVSYNERTATNNQAATVNAGSTENVQAPAKTDIAPEQDISFSSLNMSPYLLGVLPDTTTFSDNYDDDYDDDADREEDSYSDEDDDVFLHPIY